MAYVNKTAEAAGFHGVFESSRLKATDVGRIHDTLVVSDYESSKTPIEIDNGVAVKICDFVGSDLQQIYATLPKVEDKIAVVGTDPVVKDATTKGREGAIYFTNKAGKLSRTYEVLNDSQEIFGIADYQFTDGSKSHLDIGKFVSVDGKGMWVAADSSPEAANTGFIGKIHSIAADSLGQYRIVRVQCVQNIQATPAPVI